MSSAQKASDGSNLQAALDDLHADVAAHNMAPFWVVDRTVKNDEDKQIRDTAQGRALQLDL